MQDFTPSWSTEGLHHCACRSLCPHGKELPHQGLGVSHRSIPLNPHTHLKIRLYDVGTLRLSGELIWQQAVDRRGGRGPAGGGSVRQSILGYLRGAVMRTPTTSCGKNVVVGTGARGLMEADFRTW